MKNILNISKEELINTLGIQKNFIYEQIMDFVYKGKRYNEMFLLLKLSLPAVISLINSTVFS